MDTVIKEYPPSYGPPLACDCQGAGVYIIVGQAREHFTTLGYFVASIASRTQHGNGSWTYHFTVPDEQIVGGPLPEDIAFAVACKGCIGVVLDRAAHDEFDRVILSPSQDIAVGSYHVGFMPRSFLIEDGIRVSWPVPGSAPMPGNDDIGFFSIRLKAGDDDLLSEVFHRIRWSLDSIVIPMTMISTVGKAVIRGGTRLTCIIEGIAGNEEYVTARGLEIAYRGRWT